MSARQPQALAVFQVYAGARISEESVLEQGVPRECRRGAGTYDPQAGLLSLPCHPPSHAHQVALPCRPSGGALPRQGSDPSLQAKWGPASTFWGTDQLSLKTDSIPDWEGWSLRKPTRCSAHSSTISQTRQNSPDGAGVHPAAKPQLFALRFRRLP